uniref:Uncharacterized protein n=1 Tax=Romanomermis culicivorax TaxID=13658 RepID=A0A915I4Z6_ROMCU
MVQAAVSFNITWQNISLSSRGLSTDTLERFFQDLGGMPLHGRYYHCRHVGEADYLCGFLKEDPKLPAIYRSDAELISNGKEKWSTWELKWRKFPVSPKDSAGPFATVIQICRTDGHVVVFNLPSMVLIPTAVIDLLLGAGGIIGFDYRQDYLALQLTDNQLERLDIAADPRVIWEALCKESVVEYIRERVSSQLPMPMTALTLFGTPFSFKCNPGLSPILNQIFPTPLDKSLRGRQLDWASNRPENCYKYAAINALAVFDVYYILDKYYKKWRSLTSQLRADFRFRIFEFLLR